MPLDDRDMASRERLREELGARRAALDDAERQAAARRLLGVLRSHLELTADALVAVYHPVRGEIDPRPWLEASDARWCLPVLEGDGRMLFRRWLTNRPLHHNRFRIPEPGPEAGEVAPALLDIVIVPLVAFDAHGNRLGMGAGYYDRCFAFRKGEARGRPRLVGVAHHFQQVERLQEAPWDVPLDAVATDRAWINVNDMGDPS